MVSFRGGESISGNHHESITRIDDESINSKDDESITSKSDVSISTKSNVMCQLAPSDFKTHNPGIVCLGNEHTHTTLPQAQLAPPCTPPSVPVVLRTKVRETTGTPPAEQPGHEDEGVGEGQPPSKSCVCALSEGKNSKQTYLEESEKFCPHHEQLMELIEAAIERKMASISVFSRGRKQMQFWNEMYSHCMEMIKERDWLSSKTVQLHPVLRIHFNNPHQFARLRGALTRIDPENIRVFQIRNHRQFFVTTADKLKDVEIRISKAFKEGARDL